MEITFPLAIDEKQASLLDMHSVLNVLNVVQYELLRLSDYCKNPPHTEALCHEILNVAEALEKPEEAIARIRGVEALVNAVNDSLRQLKQNGYADDPFVKEVESNLAGIFAIIRVRAKEIESRWDEPKAWKAHSIQQLKDNFQAVFHAIEENSHGAYRIVNNLAQHEEGDYLLQFDIDSANGETIDMPPVFQDVMRDLLANARKYTSPGGKITGGLYQDQKGLTFVVQDSGYGILPEEIERVISFGGRGSNNQGRPTRGGGFGLTKAYYITKSFGGRMFIDSPVENNRGTRIKITLPLA